MGQATTDVSLETKVTGAINSCPTPRGPGHNRELNN